MFRQRGLYDTGKNKPMYIRYDAYLPIKNEDERTIKAIDIPHRTQLNMKQNLIALYICVAQETLHEICNCSYRRPPLATPLYLLL